MKQIRIKTENFSSQLDDNSLQVCSKKRVIALLFLSVSAISEIKNFYDKAFMAHILVDMQRQALADEKPLKKDAGNWIRVSHYRLTRSKGWRKRRGIF